MPSDKMIASVEELIHGLFPRTRQPRPDERATIRTINPRTLDELTLTLFQLHNNAMMTLPRTRYPQLGRAPANGQEQ